MGYDPSCYEYSLLSSTFLGAVTSNFPYSVFIYLGKQCLVLTSQINKLPQFGSKISIDNNQPPSH